METNYIGARWEYIEALQRYLNLHLDGVSIDIVRVYQSMDHNILISQIEGNRVYGTHSFKMDNLTNDEILEKVVKILKQWKLVPIEDHVKNS